MGQASVIIPAEVAIERLRAGNARFASRLRPSVRGWRADLVSGQNPFAVVLGCSDSRVPAEYVFDQGFGDLFVIRVAGNIVAPSLLGSVEFAVSKFGTRLIVVLGHTRCGAVEETLSALRSGERPATGNLRSITDRIRPALEPLGAAEGSGPILEQLLEATRANVRASLDRVRTGSAMLEEHLASGQVALVGAVYEVESGRVRFLDEPDPEHAWIHQTELFAD
jgi:carbonic anhydrase